MQHQSNRKVAQIEELVGKNIRRDISRMTAFTKGSLEKAALAILNHPRPHVGIVTGFYIEHAEPPSPETDGLGGAAHMAAALAACGIKVTVITDAPCAKAVWAVVDQIPEKVDLEITGLTEESVRALRTRLETVEVPLTHLIAIERVSPGSDGKPHREHGWDMTRQTAPLHLLFEEAGWNRPWTTIGIGDGGNEIGMANLPKDIIDHDIPNGPLIAATVPADHLVVAGVSTWGGYAMVGAFMALDPARRAGFAKYLNRDFDLNVLRAAVEVGQAIDDSRPDRKGQLRMSVDRLPWSDHAEMLETVASLAA